MKQPKYKVLIDGTVVAENMDIEIATTIVKALFNSYGKFRYITISIKEMGYIEEPYNK